MIPLEQHNENTQLTLPGALLKGISKTSIGFCWCKHEAYEIHYNEGIK